MANAAPEPLRFAALGDSLTEGLGDPLPDGGHRGWAALLADGLPAPGRGVHVVNLARSGARTRDAAGEQLAAARAFRPHVAALVIGVNDTLRSAFDIGHAARALDSAIGALSADGAVVLTACLPDPGRMLRLPHALGVPLARRMAALNEVVHALSQRHGTVHAHLAGHPMVADPAAWSVDRLHPSELGHRLLARQFHALLTAHGRAAGPPPSPLPERPPPGRAAGTWWMATRGTRWVVARSVDLIPGLVRLACVEARHRLAGTEHTLDRAARAATAAALRTTGCRPAHPAEASTSAAAAPPARAPAAG
ncbi:SGNH/GDSL hydrolase family protein [Streptomyces sp. B6B3]|uniref:SGNH/GDSL hydrolase family protein n=1 Tax=Streptomyces sp. B6B3 TaxID=3153570 RepID=UPI00325F4BAE